MILTRGRIAGRSLMGKLSVTHNCLFGRPVRTMDRMRGNRDARQLRTVIDGMRENLDVIPLLKVPLFVGSGLQSDTQFLRSTRGTTHI